MLEIPSVPEYVRNDTEKTRRLFMIIKKNMRMKLSELIGTEDKKKIQSLISLCILLAGLLIGSFFVDIIQLVTRSGFSEHAINENDILETNGRTWVAYADPLIDLVVLTDSSCGNCDPEQALTWIRRVMPTTTARSVDYASEEGTRMAIEEQVTVLPAFLFSKNIQYTNFYAQASSLFTETDTSYILDMTKIGETPGKFLKLPEVEGDDISLGSNTANITVIEYSDFQCPYSKLFHSSIQKMMKDYPNDIRFIYKHFPLSFHPQAENAALASECANEMGKFEAYANMLFAKQDDWGKTSGTMKFKEYARTLSMDTRKFNACLDTKKYSEKVKSDTEEARSFGISGTPGTFLNDQFINGAVSYDELKGKIDAKLAE